MTEDRLISHLLQERNNALKWAAYFEGKAEAHEQEINKIKEKSDD